MKLFVFFFGLSLMILGVSPSKAESCADKCTACCRKAGCGGAGSACQMGCLNVQEEQTTDSRKDDSTTSCYQACYDVNCNEDFPTPQEN